MPFTQTEEGGWGKKMKFNNLRGRKFDRLFVVSLIAFDFSDMTNAFWRCQCQCTRPFNASTHEIEASRITACDACMASDDFPAEAILIVKKRNETIPVGEEIIFKGNDRSSIEQIKVEYCGKFMSLSRSLVAATGKCF